MRDATMNEMRGRARAAVLAWAVVVSAVSACDPVRPGTFTGHFPPPINFQVPSDVGQLDVDLTVKKYLPTRRWIDSGQSSAGAGFSGTTGATTVKLSVWEQLADNLTVYPAEPLLDSSLNESIGFGSITGVADYVFVVASTANTLFSNAEVQPVGASGPSLHLQSGFQLLHRTCTADDPNQFEVVPFDTVVSYDSAAAANERAGLDPYVQKCNLQVNTVPDLGDIVAPLTDSFSTSSYDLGIAELAWTPDSDILYVLAGNLEAETVDLVQLKIGETGATRLASGAFYGPLVVATGGTSLLMNQATIDWSGGNGTEFPFLRSCSSVKQALVVGGSAPLPALPVSAPWPPGDSTGVLSPDGTTLAVMSDGGRTQLVDVGQETISVADLGPGSPVAWDPGGASLLVTYMGDLSLLSLDGTVGSLPSAGIYLPVVYDTEASTTTKFFWTASGPQMLIQNGQGAHVYDVTKRTTTELVEASRVAPPTAPVGVVVATNQVFAWALQCFGIGETSCNGELRRLSLATGVRDVVAHAGAPLPFAVSPDGTKIAFSDGKNIYVKSIQP
jgi:hypothetical protein